MLLWVILLNRWFILGLGVLFMLIGLKPDWTMSVVRTVGKMGWAEQKLGQGGTFNIWKWIGVLAPIAAIIYFFSGGVQFTAPEVANPTNDYNYSSQY